MAKGIEVKNLKEALEFVKLIEPDFYSKMNSRMHHYKKKFAGAFGAAIVACEILGQLLG